MIKVNTVKKLGYAMIKLSQLNTSLHYYLKTDQPESIIKHGQGLQIISKAFGSPTYKGFYDAVERGLVNADDFKRFGNDEKAYREWVDMVKTVAKIESDAVAVTLAGMFYFLLENTFDVESSYAEHDYSTILLALKLNPHWTTEYTEPMLNHVREKLKECAIPECEPHDGINLMVKMMYTTNYYFFESIFRCAVFNSLNVHAYSMQMFLKNKSFDKYNPVIFSKTPKDAVHNPDLIFTLNSLVGDFFYACNELNVNKVSELISIPYHKNTLYKDSRVAIVDWDKSKLKEHGGLRHQRFTQFMNKVVFNATNTDHKAMFDRYMQNHNIQKSSFVDLVMYLSHPTWLNPNLGQIFLSGEIAFLFDNQPSGLTHVEGMQALMYRNILSQFDAVLKFLGVQDIKNLDQCLLIDRFGVVVIDPEQSQSALVDIAYNGDKQGMVSMYELSLMVNILAVKWVLNQCNDPQVTAFKWVYWGMLLQLQTYYFNLMRSDVANTAVMQMAELMGVPVPKHLINAC